MTPPAHQWRELDRRQGNLHRSHTTGRLVEPSPVVSPPAALERGLGVGYGARKDRTAALDRACHMPAVVGRVGLRPRVLIQRGRKQVADRHTAGPETHAEPVVVQALEQFLIHYQCDQGLLTGHRIQSNPGRLLHVRSIAGYDGYAIYLGYSDSRVEGRLVPVASGLPKCA